MLAIRLSPEVEARLAALAKATGRTKTYYAREAIVKHLDEMERVYLAEWQRIEACAGGGDLSRFIVNPTTHPNPKD